MSSKIAIIKGDEPILAITLHPLEQKTVEYNQKLHSEENCYSLIYGGPRERCIQDTEQYFLSLINEMLTKYEKIGIISLHRRTLSSRNIKSPLNQAELGTLKGQSLDELIVANLAERLVEKRIIFDYNTKLTGGEEIRIIHKQFNDPDYKEKKINQNHSPINNKVQIVQLELNGPDSKNPPSYELVKETGRCILNYLK
ncbi:hypothetical protein HON71_04635 [Candidatus Woesearchaeota archaeon]|jgi:hypothetical protein|nr:hypothetical protein [Candidatus Woesearchaeota archaeon]MBT5343244.1 hypothetical protein [Candidatus Woesearchaeota archaeon]